MGYHPDTVNPHADFPEASFNFSVGTGGLIVDLGAQFPYVEIINDGSNSVFVSGAGLLPDASFGEVKPGEAFAFGRPSTTLMAGRRYIGIATSASTTTGRIKAWA